MDAFRFAVIADAHFHDIEADYGFAGLVLDGGRLALRSFAETRISTRVFNESHRALHVALDQVLARGIRHVVLLGDYSDDGQRITMVGLRTILLRYERVHGIRFWALPGNHDIFALEGRHQTKEFIGADGARVTVSSDPDHARHVAGLHCAGYPEGLTPMAKFGYFRRPDDLHWETPFGLSDRAEDRVYEVVSPNGETRHRLMDASYLVEPVPGVWFMMIDANVFAPLDHPASRADAFEDSTAAGWNGMMQHKPFIFAWIADVQERARRAGKKLLMFSHYPVLDPFDDHGRGEARLFGAKSFARRIPQPDVGERLLSAGGGIHFSGHLHVHSTTTHDKGESSLVNIAVPSLVAFPAAWKEVSLGAEEIVPCDRPLGDIACDPRIAAAYRLENRGGEDHPCFSAGSYGAFLKAHMRGLVSDRFIARDWPEQMADLPGRITCGEACAVAGVTPPSALAALPFFEIVCDWYMLRNGGAMARAEIEPTRLAFYDALTLSPAAISDEATFLNTFFAMLGHYARQARKPAISHALQGAGLSAAE
ncbi:metallophosphoesterase family protein [Martelella limonii]|uniref:metallophosphoesterase family protein n=1 Tax=Martelella limonii TaxID=1647649 RepID=UPI001580AF37|nr:metallophosphoesterase [Martelella limonii]